MEKAYESYGCRTSWFHGNWWRDSACTTPLNQMNGWNIIHGILEDHSSFRKNWWFVGEPAVNLPGCRLFSQISDLAKTQRVFHNNTDDTRLTHPLDSQVIIDCQNGSSEQLVASNVGGVTPDKKTNIALENRVSQNETTFPTIHFQFSGANC